MDAEREHRVGPSSAGSEVWSALLALTDRTAHARLGHAPALAWEPGCGLVGVAAQVGNALFTRTAAGELAPSPMLPEPGRSLAELYLPIAGRDAERRYVIGHLGQSLDGFIATRSGDSDFVTGPENLDHLHRMRALCKAVVVGAGTIASDDPELTTRRVPGPSPVRVILDPKRRLGETHRVFRDRKAETWIVCAEALAARTAAGAQVIGVPQRNGTLALDVMLDELEARGLDTVFVEGGGVTVSRFLRANLLDRVQIAVAPLVIGEGRPGLRVAGADSLAACLRPRCRMFAMGHDVLFDCEPRRDADRGTASAPPRRID